MSVITALKNPNATLGSVKAKLKTGGTARISFNSLSGDWFIDGQKNSPIGYISNSLTEAINLAKTINHYNETGERKAFAKGKATEIEIVK
jgi:hypothetical protein